MTPFRTAPKTNGSTSSSVAVDSATPTQAIPGWKMRLQERKQLVIEHATKQHKPPHLSQQSLSSKQPSPIEQWVQLHRHSQQSLWESLTSTRLQEFLPTPLSQHWQAELSDMIETVEDELSAQIGKDPYRLGEETLVELLSWEHAMCQRFELGARLWQSTSQLAEQMLKLVDALLHEKIVPMSVLTELRKQFEAERDRLKQTQPKGDLFFVLMQDYRSAVKTDNEALSSLITQTIRQSRFLLLAEVPIPLIEHDILSAVLLSPIGSLCRLRKMTARELSTQSLQLKLHRPGAASLAYASAFTDLPSAVGELMIRLEDSPSALQTLTDHHSGHLARATRWMRCVKVINDVIEHVRPLQIETLWSAPPSLTRLATHLNIESRERRIDEAMLARLKEIIGLTKLLEEMESQGQGSQLSGRYLTEEQRLREIFDAGRFRLDDDHQLDRPLFSQLASHKNANRKRRIKSYPGPW